MIDSEGLHKSTKHLKTLENAPPPTNVSEVKSFLGMVNFYAKFVHNFSTILAPLYNLLKKSTKFEWSESCQ